MIVLIYNRVVLNNDRVDEAGGINDMPSVIMRYISLLFY